MSKQKTKYAPVGGQALMEGVMMTGPSGTAMALRLQDGSIQTEMKEFKRLKNKYKILGIPFLRGIVNMVETQVFGCKCLMESAEKTTLDFEDDDTENMSKLDKWLTEHLGPKMMAVIGGISAVLGIVMAFGLFLWLPSFLFDSLNHVVPVELLPYKALAEGLLRVALFVGYMALVARMKEIRRVFMYHGAEHKSIFCYEAQEELTVENVRKQKRFHPRCGTSFIFVTILLSIFVSVLISTLFPVLREPNMRLVWMLVKLLMLPFILGTGYECIMLAGKYQNWFTRVLTAPGIWMQRITTAEPDDEMIEVAIEALKAALGMGKDPLEAVDPAQEKQAEPEEIRETMPLEQPEPLLPAREGETPLGEAAPS